MSRTVYLPHATVDYDMEVSKNSRFIALVLQVSLWAELLAGTTSAHGKSVCGTGSYDCVS